ncbi:unnamed protein product [Dibothriocephalus latus]|uniref:Uncharacterized protein n=1 Tax=Dibothriocephalus latus TaxID=60516 RepID=A0A3P7KZH3_DIBLA|nr:unnamed protein product [Dibothriocephalus latus]
MAGNPESGGAARQAQSVADCSLAVRQCLRCYGKVPRTSQETEFALAIDTGPAVTGLLPGDAPRFCLLGGLADRVRDLLNFSPPTHVVVSEAAFNLINEDSTFEAEPIAQSPQFGSIHNLMGKSKASL